MRCCSYNLGDGRLGRFGRLGLCALSEAILEFSRQRLEVSSASGSSGSSTLGLGRPLDCDDK